MQVLSPQGSLGIGHLSFRDSLNIVKGTVVLAKLDDQSETFTDGKILGRESVTAITSETRSLGLRVGAGFETDEFTH